MDRSSRSALTRLAAVPLLLGLTVTGVEAQAADFLFHRPHGSVSLYGGWAMPREAGDIFDEARDWYTVERGDFAGPVIGGEVAVWLAPRIDGFLTVERAGARHQARDQLYWEPTPDPAVDLPIQHDLEFNRTTASSGVRVYLLPRGRSLGQLAWVPARWSPFVGAGAGFSWFQFAQDGDFVTDRGIFEDEKGIVTRRYESSGRATTMHAQAGVDMALTPRIVLRGEYRYLWGVAAFSNSLDYRGYGDINLGGGRATVGVAFRF
jgi:hypothetical protein